MSTKSRTRRANTPEEVENRVAKSADTRTVRRYLEALEAGFDRSVDTTSLHARLDQVLAELPTAGPVQRVKLIQERLNLENAIEIATADYGWEQIEADALAVLARWAEDKGISYRALREVGVPAAALKAAGVPRS